MSRAKVKSRGITRFFHLVDALIIAIIIAATAICVSINTRTRSELAAVNSKHQAAADRVADLRVKVDLLEREVNQLKADSKFIESFARKKFGFVRPGDIVIQLAQNEQDTSSE